MTIEEAIKILDINKIISFRCTGFVEAAECAISALEKQIPKKGYIEKVERPIFAWEDTVDMFVCPVCKNYHYEQTKYCPNCGQRIF